ncbi:hypothetical protein QBC40DRAFT_71767 [Triangularia verruculosa]|uniref:RING-type domain-containing protein n=1 Tax=Triangularia verruculosa TaxID=2587418 RepID=A0AAN6XHA9_9PEZI|nr:hypothetical protein QBC40DRAFT_71767 [Triangularia verruculosa]
MRPPRIAILVLFFSASLFLVCRAIGSLRHPNAPAVTPLTAQKSSFRSFLSFTSPFSLFPPNAAISLFDDNSTFFAARPAAFGPILPADGLSGQLWIGSGFAEDHLQEGEVGGELGCSDLPGWEDGRPKLSIKTTLHGSAGSKSGPAPPNTKNTKRDPLGAGISADRKHLERRHDGTDDYLHQELDQTRALYSEGSAISASSHADIQSMQETAEITGKITLLSRGGCGFLEKVKWAQRRGAIGVIVGDNVKGGPLIQMFARGNVDNVSIPSIFTSRTTAMLLSSLAQPGSFIEDILDENGNPILKVQQSGKPGANKQTKAAGVGHGPKSVPNAETVKTESLQDAPAPAAKKTRSRRGWISRLFSWGDGGSNGSDQSRPPSSGRLNWVTSDEWSDGKDQLLKSSPDKTAKNNAGGRGSSEEDRLSGDDFQIGVQDWRDPDLVGSSVEKEESHSAPENQPSSEKIGSLRGGSITPGSGEYVPGGSYRPGSGKTDSSSEGSSGLISKLFGDDAREQADAGEGSAFSVEASGEKTGDDVREGLWVTITPTGSASPFFDTLLVLVISPLITLTVVYTLLILRAKYRRRRWRAPKAVVDRLPVRTYRTVAPSPSQSSRTPSPTSSSPTTPLLQGNSRSRPRSQTTTGVPDSSDLLRVDNALQAGRSSSPDKSRVHGSSQWKKYMGRQSECVICLEEYVDGVSQVMSLPCGHEFHVDCITPWLTTRRRTCPICKNDIVKSLARGSPSSPHYEPYHDDSDYNRPEPTAFGNSHFASYSSNRLSDVEEGREALARVQREIHEVRWYDFMAHLMRGEPGQAFLNRHQNRRFVADDHAESRS